jgi:hypothetical protein
MIAGKTALKPSETSLLGWNWGLINKIHISDAFVSALHRAKITRNCWIWSPVYQCWTCLKWLDNNLTSPIHICGPFDKH